MTLQTIDRCDPDDNDDNDDENDLDGGDGNDDSGDMKGPFFCIHLSHVYSYFPIDWLRQKFV